MAERAARSRAATQAALVRELLYASILSTFWPAHICPAKRANDEYKHVLCVQTPAGLLTWRVTAEELSLFEHLPRREQAINATDRTAILLALATDLLVEAK